MPDELYPSLDPELSRKRRELASDAAAAFAEFSKQVFADGALPARIKQLIAVAVAHVTQCPYCIRGHTRGALRAGASEAEIMEAIWVAAEMRAGGSYAHSIIALSEMDRVEGAEASLHGSADTGEHHGSQAERVTP
jgi:AhpD family alkylhydroperoxidase